MMPWGDIPPAGKNDFPLSTDQKILIIPDGRYCAEARHFHMYKGQSLDANELERLKQLTERHPEAYTSATKITFVVDSVLLADGKFIGPDRANAFTGWSNRLISEAAVARAVLAFRSRSTDELQRYLTTIAVTDRRSLVPGDMPAARWATTYQWVLKQKGQESVFEVAANDLRNATNFSIHR